MLAPAAGGSGVRNVEAAVDSGAEDSVPLPDIFSGPVSPSPMSRAGHTYRAAHGAPSPSLGHGRAL